MLKCCMNKATHQQHHAQMVRTEPAKGIMHCLSARGTDLLPYALYSLACEPFALGPTTLSSLSLWRSVHLPFLSRQVFEIFYANMQAERLKKLASLHAAST